MADHVKGYTASGLVASGPGQVMGISMTASAGAPQVIFYDNTSAAIPQIFAAFVSYLTGVHLFFPEKYALTFDTGLYVSIAAGANVTIWFPTL